jgi:hypothetical protein
LFLIHIQREGVVPVRAGEFAPEERRAIDVAIRAAETVSRCEFSVYVGPTEQNHRDYAERMHAVMASPNRSLLMMINPEDRAIEVVTGSYARRVLRDSCVAGVLAAMKPLLAADDVVSGVVFGLGLLEEEARGAVAEELRQAS